MSKNKLVKEYIEYMKRERKSDNTVDAYIRDLEMFFSWSKNKSILSLTMDDMKGYRDILMTTYESNTTINRRIMGVKSFYEFLLRYKHIKDLPTKFMDTLPVEQKLPEYLTKEEARSLYSSLDVNKKFYLRDKCILVMLLNTGLRNSELRNIKIDDINFNNKTVKIIGKGRTEEDIVILNENCINAINEYVEWINNKKEYKNVEYLFINKNGEQLSARSLQKLIKDVSDKAQIDKDIHVHTLRHTCLTNFYNTTKDIMATKEKARHQSISTTQIYVHMDSDTLRKESELAGI